MKNFGVFCFCVLSVFLLTNCSNKADEIACVDAAINNCNAAISSISNAVNLLESGYNQGFEYIGEETKNSRLMPCLSEAAQLLNETISNLEGALYGKKQWERPYSYLNNSISTLQSCSSSLNSFYCYSHISTMHTMLCNIKLQICQCINSMESFIAEKE